MRTPRGGCGTASEWTLVLEALARAQHGALLDADHDRALAVEQLRRRRLEEARP